MNLIKAADDLKNLSDQQLMMAGQNPVSVPPYLVLAEMKRREQLRAEFSKSQQQQPQPTVIQQTAQNLAQQQPQQMQQQAQPQAQGIMQTAPPQVVAMAGGGHVARYAEGDLVQAADGYAKAVGNFMEYQPTMSSYKAPGIATSYEQMRAMYPETSFADFKKSAETMYGTPDYSAEQELVARQMEQAKKGRPIIGDAFLSAARELAQFNPRETFAGKLARGIMGATQSIQSGREQQKKDMQAAMMANIALERMKREDEAKKVQAAMELSRQDRGTLISFMQTAEANSRALANMQQRATTEAEKMRIENERRRLGSQVDITKAALEFQEKLASNKTQLDVARIRAAAPPRTIDNSFKQSAEMVGILQKQQEQLAKQMESLSPNSPQYKQLSEKLNSVRDQIDLRMDELGQISAGSGIRVVDLGKK